MIVFRAVEAPLIPPAGNVAPILEVRGLKARYGQIEALHGLTFSIGRASWSRWSAPTAPAKPRCCACCPGAIGRAMVTSSCRARASFAVLLTSGLRAASARLRKGGIYARSWLTNR
jgi:hypothetical protein